MTTPNEYSDEAVDRLVLAHLEREADSVDAARVLDGVRARMCRAPSRTGAGWARRARQLSVAAAAALVGVAVLLWLVQPTSVRASAEVLVREAREALAAPADRHYRIETSWEPWVAERFPALAMPRTADLWTRGDRFRVEATGPKGRRTGWGRDVEGRVWFAPSPNLCLVHQPEEVSEPLSLMCDFYTLGLKTLLNDVLVHYDLSEPEADLVSGLVSIRATPKPENHQYRMREVTLGLDPETKVIREVVVKRLVGDRVAGYSTFTLLETVNLPDVAYAFRTHLEEGARVLDHSRPKARAVAMQAFHKRHPKKGTRGGSE